MKKIKNKKIVLVLILLFTISATFAYFTTTDSFENIFKTGKYGAKIEEIFESPTDWKPGDETPKIITATNTGNICENVRVSYTEEWTSKNGGNLPLMDSTLNENIAIINFDNTADWKKNGNYYYYNKNLLENETTTSFIKSVTYNPKYQGDITCTKTSEGTTKTEECKSGNDSYDGATYKLTITVETIQCDAMESEWGIKLDDLQPKYRIVSGDLDTVGSEVCIDTECFYVIGKEKNNIKLFAKYNLKVGNVYDNVGNKIKEYTNGDENYGLQDENMKGCSTGETEYRGTIAFSTTNYWHDAETDQPKAQYGDSYNTSVYVFDQNSIPYPYVQNYVNYLTSKGVIVTGRLIDLNETNFLMNNYLEAEWRTNYSHWTGSAIGKECVGFIRNISIPTPCNMIKHDDCFGVRPVIILEP